MKIWQAHEAKAHFRELVERPIKDGPQMVTLHGEEAVVAVAADEFCRLSGQTPRLLDWLLNAPRGEPLPLGPAAEAIRDMGL